MSSTPRVRELTPEDWRTYRDLRLRSLAESPDAFGRTLSEEQGRTDAQWMGRLASCAEFDLPLVAEVDGVAVGLAWGKIEASSPETAHLYQMWVAPTHRRLGVGRMLLDAVINWASKASVRRIVLGVTCGDTPATRLYQRAGFKPDGEPVPLRQGSTLLEQHMQLEIRP